MADTEMSYAFVNNNEHSTDKDPSGSGPNQPHSRTYQACIPCRRRKVRCNLGPVDNPHEPPCDRCRREAKECFFSATRRKRRAVDSGAFEEVEQEELEVKGGRKRLKGEELERETQEAGYTHLPLTPGGSVAQRHPLRRPIASSRLSTQSLEDDPEDEQLNSQTAAILQTGEIHSGHDALNVLYLAATTHRTTSTGSSTRPSIGMDGMTSQNLPSATSPIIARRSYPNLQHQSLTNSPSDKLDPSITTASTSNNAASELSEALNAWSRFRFVRSGWFTAREGIDYVNYFYAKMLPLTPIALPNYSSLANQPNLLTDEPMLTVTILTIATRYMRMTGASSHSRPHAIHHKLWQYLQGMINRLVWGQERFDNDLANAGADIDPYSRKGLRTIGTVESLMLLTEWHPRSLHFPPEDDDTELMLPKDFMQQAETDDATADAARGIGGQRIDTWLRPAWRSDRICWMQLSMANALAFEIGVFDENTSRHIQSIPYDRRQAYETRRLHAKSLLLAYTTQTSGRIGIASMMPQTYGEPSLSEAFESNSSHTSTTDLVIHLFLRIASIIKVGHRELFPNRQYTREIIQNGRYRDLLHDIQPRLAAWKADFERAKSIPLLLRHILVIEYEYCRVYLNSLGLQAVIERCTRNTPKQASDSSAIPPATLERWYGNDRFYVREVIDGSRHLLKTIVDGLHTGEHLRHLPVRAYFRTMAAVIILLKTFALGASEDDVAISLSYLDRLTSALRTCIVDDVHLAIRFADLVEILTKRIRSRLVRMARNGTNGSNGTTRAVSKSPTHAAFPQLPTQAQPSTRNVQLNPTWTSTNHTFPPPFAHDRNTPSNPLYGISTQTYDFNDDDVPFSVMPPPTLPPSPSMTQTALNGDSNTGAYASYPANNGYMDNYGGNVADWLALPLDPILNSYGADVTHTGYGPGVGQFDMLELLLGEDPSRMA